MIGGMEKMVMNTENYMVIINDYDNIAILKFDGEHCEKGISFTDENIYEHLQDMDEDEADAYIDGLYTSFYELANLIDVNISC